MVFLRREMDSHSTWAKIYTFHDKIQDISRPYCLSEYPYVMTVNHLSTDVQISYIHFLLIILYRFCNLIGNTFIEGRRNYFFWSRVLNHICKILCSFKLHLITNMRDFILESSLKYSREYQDIIELIRIIRSSRRNDFCSSTMCIFGHYFRIWIGKRKYHRISMHSSYHILRQYSSGRNSYKYISSYNSFIEISFDAWFAFWIYNTGGIRYVAKKFFGRIEIISSFIDSPTTIYHDDILYTILDQ